MNDAPPALQKSSWVSRMKDFGYLILLLAFIEIADRAFFNNSLETHGIHPRSFAHWEGLLFAPFLHAGWGHLFSNSISLLVLGSVILAWGWRELAIVSAVSALTAGILVWLIGTSGTNHIGASSVVFGYLGFLLASGFYRRTPITIMISMLVVIFYGSAIMGILPTENIRNANISWEAHLGGALGGIFIARSRRLKMASHSDFSTR